MVVKVSNLILAILFYFFLAAYSQAQQTSLDGEWEGALVRESSEAKISVNFKTTATDIDGTMTMATVGMFRQPLSKIAFNSPQAHFEQENLAAIFDGEIRADQIVGNLQVIGLTGTFYLKRSKDEPLPYKHEEVSFRNGTVTLSGTLTTPRAGGRHAATVFTHGGGPDTRDLSRFYADLFARRGVATLIYDKRGVGKSAPELDWGRSSFNDLAGDALAGVQFLKTRNEINPKRIGLYGPSNGAWVVEYAAARSKDVAFIIVVSGGGIPSWESEVYRVEAQTRAENFSEDAITEAVAFMRHKFEVARTGQGWEQLQTLMDRSRKAKWFRFVNAPRSLDGLREAWTGQFWYDPYPDLRKLKIPVLAIFGELDTETPAKTISAKTEDALKRGGNNNYTIKVFPRATHGIMLFPEAGQPWHFFRFADGYVDLMTDWVLKQTKS